MASRALSEDKIRRFLQRRRRGTGVVGVPAVGPVLVETLDLAARLVPCEAGSLLLDDPTRRDSPLTFVSVLGPASESLVGLEVPVGHGIVGEVYRSGETYRTSAPADDPHFFAKVDEISAFRTRSLVATPIRLERRVCGVFELVNRRGRAAFEARDVEIVELLAGYVARAILNAIDIRKQNHLALHDELTGVRNVRGLDAYLRKQLRRADRRGGDLSVMFVDVDHLKKINDRLGHRAGSEALRRVGHGLGEALGDAGHVFRFGGDEFVIVLPDRVRRDAEDIGRSLRRAVLSRSPGPMRFGGSLPPVSICVGVASLRQSLRSSPSERTDTRAARLLAAADTALYRAKRSGRSRVVGATRRDDRLRG